MSDPFIRYEYGLVQLLEALSRAHPRYGEALSYQQQLMENIERARRYGETAEYKADSRRVLDQLNSLALATIGQSFNELAGLSAGGDLRILPAPFERVHESVTSNDSSNNVEFKAPAQLHDIVFGNQTTNNVANIYGPINNLYTASREQHWNSQMTRLDSTTQTLLNDLRLQLRAHAPSTLMDAGMQQIVLLAEAISIPSPTQMAAVLDWVNTFLPSQASAFKAIIRHRAVVRIVMAAGANVIAEYRSRFGELSNEEA